MTGINWRDVVSAPLVVFCLPFMIIGHEAERLAEWAIDWSRRGRKGMR